MTVLSFRGAAAQYGSWSISASVEQDEEQLKDVAKPADDTAGEARSLGRSCWPVSMVAADQSASHAKPLQGERVVASCASTHEQRSALLEIKRCCQRALQ